MCLSQSSGQLHFYCCHARSVGGLRYNGALVLRTPLAQAHFQRLELQVKAVQRERKTTGALSQSALLLLLWERERGLSSRVVYMKQSV